MKIPDLSYEKSLIPPNCRYLLGIDEVGRGPWAGPVTIGAFLLDLKNFDTDFFTKNIRDSKILSPKQRKSSLEQIIKRNYKFEVISAEPSEIDRLGIQGAINNCINKALEFFYRSCDFVLLDGNLNMNIQMPHLSVCKADLNCFSVAAASVCAKVNRDQAMIELAKKYPGYDFENNKGYGTKLHQLGLQQHGPCEIHRFSYKPIKDIVTSRQL
jgi:ribonuclease HII